MTRAHIIALIPARGGSKGLPGKNLRPLLGLPLLAHSIRQAMAARHVRSVCVTTDDPDIARVARAFGAQVVDRPADLSGDTASSESALLHALDHLADAHDLRPDFVCFLQCTSPIRRARDIDGAIETLLAERADSLLSVSPSHRFLWRRGDDGAESLNYDWRQRPRRQDMAPQFVENGSIYLFRPDDLRRTGNRLSGRIALYEMDEVAAYEVDSMLDFRIVESALQSHTDRTPA